MLTDVERHLDECRNAIAKQDLVAAYTSAGIAHVALNLLEIDLDRKLRDIETKPPTRRKKQ